MNADSVWPMNESVKRLAAVVGGRAKHLETEVV